MRLYHITSIAHWGEIMKSGQITVTESNVGMPKQAEQAFIAQGRLERDHTYPVGEHVAPDVVWLTEDPWMSQAWQATQTLENSGIDQVLINQFRKDRVLFTVEVDDDEVVRWRDFADEHNMFSGWYDALDDDDLSPATRWWVLPRPIVLDEIVSAHEVLGRPLFVSPKYHADLPSEFFNPQGLVLELMARKKDDDPIFPKITALYPAPQAFRAFTLRTKV